MREQRLSQTARYNRAEKLRIVAAFFPAGSVLLFQPDFCEYCRVLDRWNVYSIPKSLILTGGKLQFLGNDGAVCEGDADGLARAEDEAFIAFTGDGGELANVAVFTDKLID